MYFNKFVQFVETRESQFTKRNIFLSVE